MKPKLIQIEKTIDDEITTTEWFLDIDEGATVININKKFKDHIEYCEWIDEKKNFIRVNYIDWAENQLKAIMNIYGNVIMDGIEYIKEYVEPLQQFILEMSETGMGEDWTEYFLGSGDTRAAVINNIGEFILLPQYKSIRFDSTDEVYYATYDGGQEETRSISGELIEEENDFIITTKPNLKYNYNFDLSASEFDALEFFSSTPVDGKSPRFIKRLSKFLDMSINDTRRILLALERKRYIRYDENGFIETTEKIENYKE
jgi:hypothetical protein